MLTAFSVKLPPKAEGFKKLTNKLHRDKVETQILRARGVSLRHITYTSYSGEVRLDKTDGVVGTQRDRLLCSEKLVFPHSSGYRRFESSSFSARLCVNMALETLRNCQHSTELRLGIYDPTAIAADFLLHALEFCVNPVIITKNHTPYRLARERALNELGAAVSLTTRIEDLAQCDFVIAPSRIHEPLPLRSTAIVLTSGEPKPSVDGEIYYSYSFRMPNGFASLKPAELSEEYFCSALYTLGKQYAVGSIVPLTCNGKTGAQTVKSLSNLLDIQAKQAYNK